MLVVAVPLLLFRGVREGIHTLSLYLDSLPRV